MATPLALVWDLIAHDHASATFKRVGDSAETTAEKTEVAGKKIGLLGVATAAVAGAVAVHAVKMAGDFQFQMNRMVTAAGESRKNLGQVSQGVLQVMSSTGTSAKEAAAGLYLIESAGYHGADALKVLTVVAKGAKIENADLGTVANAVSSAMVDYHVKASDSATVMNTLIAAVAHGKTTLAEMSTAFSNVGAAGAMANIPMADLSAAIATMTMHGTDAAKAGTYLRQVIGQLENPSAKARKVMEGLGLDANKVGLTLSSGPGGLARTIQMLDDAITKHLTKSGLVAIETFKKSSGSISDYQKVLANLPPDMVTTFAALAQMTGGVKSLQGFLQLGGENLKTFRDNTLAINDAVKAGGKNVEGWASTQKTFNVQMDELRQTMNRLLIELGTKLLPFFTNAASGVNSFFQGIMGGTTQLDQTAHPAIARFGQGLRDLATDTVSGLRSIHTFFSGVVKAFDVRDVVSAVKFGLSSGNWHPVGIAVGDGIRNAVNEANLATARMPIAHDVIAAVKYGLDTGNWHPVGIAIGDGVRTATTGIRDVGAKLTGPVIGWFQSVDWAQVASTSTNLLTDSWSAVAGVGQRLTHAFTRWIGQVDFGAIGAGATAGFGTFLDSVHWSKLGSNMANAIAALFTNVAEISAALGGAMLRLFAHVDWLNLGKAAAKAAVPFLVGFINNLFDSVISFVAGHPGQFALFILTIIPVGKIAGILDKALGKETGKILGTFQRLILQPLEKLGGFFERVLGGLFKPIGRGIASAFTRAFPEALGGIRGLLADIGTVIAGEAKSAWLWFKNFATKALEGFGRGIGESLVWVGKQIGKVIDAVTSPFINAGKWLWQAGKDLLGGLGRGITDAVSGIGDWLKQHLVDPIINWVKGLFGIHSPSTVFAEIGKSLMDGLKQGILDNIPGVKWVQDHIVGPIQQGLGALGIGVQGGLGANLNLGNLGADAHTPGVRARAGGGPVTAGMAYIVGEHRPELFVPRTDGFILPRVPAGWRPGSLANNTTPKFGKAAAGEVHFHVHNPVPETVSESLPQMQRRVQYALGR